MRVVYNIKWESHGMQILEETQTAEGEAVRPFSTSSWAIDIASQLMGLAILCKMTAAR